MIDLTLSQLRKLNESYSIVLEAQARPTAYKNLTPEQAEALAAISPSYKSNQVWGNTSNWICSVVNRMIKFGNMDFNTSYARAKAASKNIEDFEKFSQRLKRDIQSFKTFDELNAFMDEARKNGSMTAGLSQVAKNDGRARQCYALMKNGVADYDFVITYEDDEWLVGYPTNIEYNKKFSAIGKWCHTGSFGDAEVYWSDYAQTPIYYLLNKADGYVLCASYGHSEVRNQLDNLPNGFKSSAWDEFFKSLGLEKPMVDDIGKSEEDYDVPEDATGGDIWDRVDEYEVDEWLFADLGCSLEGDDYGRNTGSFYLSKEIDVISPDAPADSDKHMHTRYAKNVDIGKYYDFNEFKFLSEEVWQLKEGHISVPILKMVVNTERFKYLWNNCVNIPYYSWSGMREITDDRTMADRFSIPEFVSILNGEANANDFGFDFGRKVQDFRNCFYGIFNKFKNKFYESKRSIFNNSHGDIDIYGSHFNISIDADEAQHLTDQIRNGNSGITFEGKPDILSVNLGGKSSFAMKRDDFSDYEVPINNCIATIKYYCHNRKDLEGQETFDLRTSDGSKYYYGGDGRYS